MLARLRIATSRRGPSCIMGQRCNKGGTRVGSCAKRLLFESHETQNLLERANWLSIAPPRMNTSTIRGWQTVIAWCTGKGLIDTSAGSARPMAKGDQHVRQRRHHPAKPHGHPRDRFHGVHSYAHGARS